MEVETKQLGVTVRIGVFVDSAVARGSDGLYVHPDSVAFITFAMTAAQKVGPVTLIARECTDIEGLVKLTDSSAITFAPLATRYSSVRDIRGVVTSVPVVLQDIRKHLSQLDVLWCFGPSPTSMLVLASAFVAKVKVVIGIRQDTLAYFVKRFTSKKDWVWLAAIYVMEGAFRVAALRSAVTAVGSPAQKRYRHAKKLVPMRVSLNAERPSAEPAPPRTTLKEIAHRRPLRLLTVGRVATEKNPAAVIEVAQQLIHLGKHDFHWKWIGDGPLIEQLRAQAEQAGLTNAVEFAGFVPPGELLQKEYEQADLFVHIALSEGLPQVLFEAAHAQLPIVATSVGGVAQLIKHAENGLLVGPNDPDALVSSINLMIQDDSLQSRLVANASATIATVTLGSETTLIARAITEWARHD